VIPWPDATAVIAVEANGISIDIVEMTTTFPNRIPISQRRYAAAFATAQPVKKTQSPPVAPYGSANHELAINKTTQGYRTKSNLAFYRK
jgi:hypothetical protein